MVLVGGALMTVLGCGPEPTVSAAARPQAAQTGQDSGRQVVAEMEGATITKVELEESIRGELAALRQQEYDLRRRGIAALAAEQLLAREAARRGISTQVLFRIEVQEKTPEPTAQQIERFYQQNKSRFGGQRKADLLTQLEQMLKREATSRRASAYRRELARAAHLRILLEPPRVEVAIPASAPALGPSSAPVTIVEFTDYQCPYCTRAQATVEQVLSTYEGKVRLVYRDFPLDFHRQAFAASSAARCAGEQDRFWDYHRGLLTTPGGFDEEDFKGRAAELGLDATLFASCLASERHHATIRESWAAATELGVEATPTFFINGRQISGARPFEDFQEIIEEELAIASTS
jgi:protein-disulfide isomerase